MGRRETADGRVVEAREPEDYHRRTSRLTINVSFCRKPHIFTQIVCKFFIEAIETEKYATSHIRLSSFVNTTLHAGSDGSGNARTERNASTDTRCRQASCSSRSGKPPRRRRKRTRSVWRSSWRSRCAFPLHPIVVFCDAHLRWVV